MIDRDTVWHEISQVIDPELGLPVTDMGLIDQLDIQGKDVEVSFHLTMPFCPDHLALGMARDIKHRVSALPEVDKVRVIVTGHVHADELNRQLEAA